MMMSMLLGANMLGAVHLEDISTSDLAIAPATAQSFFQVDSDGTVTEEGVLAYTWLLEGTNSDFEVFLTQTSGTLTPDTGTLDSWLGLGSDRGWTFSKNTNGTASFGGTLSIRHAATGIVMATCLASVTLTRDAA